MALQRKEFARRLVALRESHDPPLTQEQAAELIGVHPRQYHRWESGKSDPYLSNRERIAKAYGVSSSYLINEGDPLGLGVNGADGDELAKIHTKLDLILHHLGIPTPADPAVPTAAPPPAPPTILRPRQPAQRPKRAKPAPAAKTPATSRRKHAQ